VTVPTVVIRVEFERLRPVVYCDHVGDDDEARMGDWLEQRPDLSDLVAWAVQLAHREPAA
jgi:hypothetical protein